MAILFALWNSHSKVTGLTRLLLKKNLKTKTARAFLRKAYSHVH